MKIDLTDGKKFYDPFGNGGNYAVISSSRYGISVPHYRDVPQEKPEDDSSAFNVVAESFLQNNYLSSASSALFNSPRLFLNLITPAGENTYQQYQDPRWRDPAYQPYMRMASMVSNDEEAEEMFAYIAERIALEQRVAERGLPALDIATGFLTPDMFIPAVRGFRAHNATSALKKATNVAMATTQGVALNEALRHPFYRPPTKEEFITTVQANYLLSAGLFAIGQGVSAISKKVRQDPPPPDTSTPLNKRKVNPTSAPASAPVAAPVVVPRRDTAKNLWKIEEGETEVKIASQKPYEPNNFLLGKLKRAYKRLQTVIGTPEEGKARKEVERLVSKEAKRLRAWQKRQEAEELINPYTLSYDEFIAKKGMEKRLTYFDTSYEPVVSIPEEGVVFVKGREKKQQEDYRQSIAEESAIQYHTERFGEPTPKERKRILALPKSLDIIKKINKRSLFNASQMSPMGELRRQRLADTIRTIEGIPSDKTIPLFFNAKTGEVRFDSGARRASIVHDVEQLAEGTYRFRSNDSSMDGLEYTPPILPWKERIKGVNGKVEVQKFVDVYPDWKVAFDKQKPSPAGEEKRKVKPSEGGEPPSLSDEDSPVGRDGYISPVFAVLGDLGSVDLGDHPSGGLYEKIFNKILRTSDVLINGFGGSFILYGLTSKSDVLKNLVNLLFSHALVTRAMVKWGAPNRPAVGELIIQDREKLLVVLANSVRDYHELVGEGVANGTVTPIGFTAGRGYNSTKNAIEKTTKTVLGSRTDDANRVYTKYEDESFTLANFTETVYKVQVNADNPLHGIPERYYGLIDKTAKDLSALSRRLGDLQNKVNRGGDAIANVEHYVRREWKPERFQTQEDINAFVAVAERETRKKAVKQVVDIVDNILPELEAEIDVARGKLEQSKVAKQRNRLTKKIGKLESNKKKINDELLLHKSIAKPPNDKGLSKARDIAIAHAERIKEGKNLYEEVVEGALTHSDEKHVVKSSSQHATDVAGESRNYIYWLNTDAFQMAGMHTNAMGAVLRVLEGLQSAGFADLRALLKALDEERMGEVHRAVSGLPPAKQVVARKEVNKRYGEYKEYVIGSIDQMLDRYKNVEGVYNDFGRGTSAYITSTTLNAIPLSTASDFLKVISDNGLAVPLTHMGDGVFSRLKNLTLPEAKRIDPDGIYITEEVLRNPIVDEIRAISATVGTNSFGASTDSGVTNWLMRMASEVGVLNGVNYLNNSAKMFSAKVSTTSIMVLAEKVATGIPLSKREASRQLELGIRNRDFLDFYDAWQKTGGERREVITPWKEGHPTPMAHLWDKSLQDVFFRFITKSVSNSVFNSDKGVNSRFFSKSNLRSVVGQFVGFMSHTNTKSLAPLLIALAKKDYDAVFNILTMMLTAGYIHSRAVDGWRRNEFVQGENMPDRGEPMSGAERAYDTLDKSGLLAGLFQVLSIAVMAHDAISNDKKFDFSEVAKRGYGIPAVKLYNIFENISLAFYGKTHKDRLKGFNAGASLIPYNNALTIKPLQQRVINELTEEYKEWRD